MKLGLMIALAAALGLALVIHSHRTGEQQGAGTTAPVSAAQVQPDDGFAAEQIDDELSREVSIDDLQAQRDSSGYQRQSRVLPTPAAASTPRTRGLEELQRSPSAALKEPEQEFAAESVDAFWAGAMEARILTELSQLASGIDVVDLQVECRSTMCRVQLVYPASKAEQVLAGPGPTAFADPIRVMRERMGLEFRWIMRGQNGYGNPVSMAYISRSPIGRHDRQASDQ
jgi:hypothetical protein